MEKGFPKILKKDKLRINIYNNRLEMGIAAAQAVAAAMQKLIAEQKTVTMVFAAAPSQNEFLDALSCESGIDWHQVTAFHMDEYIGLHEAAPQKFVHYLKKRIWEKVQPGKVYCLDGNPRDPEEECARYSRLLKKYPLDIACIGIGENGHIAFNDPDVADFNDPRSVKMVDLAYASRLQQVHDSCFHALAEVPAKALTLTIPQLMAARQVFCMVPGSLKKHAVKTAVHGAITPQCPASILRRHEGAALYLDRDSAAGLEDV
jgi:glucosamine-6-phosphate deaminase